jgi:hypothetical protein
VTDIAEIEKKDSRGWWKEWPCNSVTIRGEGTEKEKAFTNPFFKEMQ